MSAGAAARPLVRAMPPVVGPAAAVVTWGQTPTPAPAPGGGGMYAPPGYTPVAGGQQGYVQQGEYAPVRVVAG